MVKVTPIQEEEAAAFFEEEKVESQESAIPNNDDEFTDTDSSESDSDNEEYDDQEDILNETIADRIIALKQIVPPSYRGQIENVSNSITALAKRSGSFVGNSLWILTTSSLLLGVPLALSIISEQQLIEMEREMKLSQSTNEVLAPGAQSGFQQPATGAI